MEKNVGSCGTIVTQVIMSSPIYLSHQSPGQHYGIKTWFLSIIFLTNNSSLINYGLFVCNFEDFNKVIILLQKDPLVATGTFLYMLYQSASMHWDPLRRPLFHSESY